MISSLKKRPRAIAISVTAFASALIKAIRAAAPGHVKLVFFNDPVLISEGLTTHLDNHDNHFHVRFCERVHPNSLYDC